MTKNAGLDLKDHFVSFIEAQIAQGRYDSPVEVVHAALRNQACGAAGGFHRGRNERTIDSVRFRGFCRTQARCRNYRSVTRFVVSPRAQADLDAICDYTVKHWVRQLETAIKAVAAEPRLGRSCDEIRAGYKKCVTFAQIAGLT